MHGFKIRRMLAAIVFVLALGAAAPVPPVHWPQHGFYHVDRIVFSDGTILCGLRGRASSDGVTLGLQLMQPKSRPLVMSIISGRLALREARWVEIGIDDASVMSFTPDIRLAVSNDTLVQHHFPDRPSAKNFIVNLATEAKLGKRLWVQTATSKDNVAAQGLSEALTDLQTCKERA